MNTIVTLKLGGGYREVAHFSPKPGECYTFEHCYPSFDALTITWVNLQPHHQIWTYETWKCTRKPNFISPKGHIDGEGSVKHDHDRIRSFMILPEKPPSRLKRAWNRACSLFRKESEESLALNGTKWLTESEYNSSEVETTVASISTADTGLSANWNDPLPDEEDSSYWRVPLPDEDVSAEFGSGFDAEEEAMTGAAPAAQPSD